MLLIFVRRAMQKFSILFLLHAFDHATEYWSVTSSNFLFWTSAFSWPVEHEENPTHTEFDMSCVMLARDNGGMNT